MPETPQRTTRRLPVLLPLPPKPGGSSMLVGGLLQCRQGGGVTLLGPSGRPKPMVGVRRCSSREKSVWMSWVLAMLLVTFVIACQGLAATARDHLPVALGIVRSAPQTTIHGPMVTCVLRTKLLPHEVIGHHGLTTQGPNAWRSVGVGVLELRKIDNSLENATWITRIYHVKRLTEVDVVFSCFIGPLLKATILQVSQGIAIPNETSLDFCIETSDGLFDGLPLTTNSKPPEGDDSGEPIAHSGAYNFENALLSDAKYNQTRKASSCPETADERTHLEHSCYNASDHVPDVVGTAPESTVHMPRFCSSHQARHLKPQQPVTNTLRRSLGAYVQRPGIQGPVGMVMPDTPEEDGTTGTQEVSRSLPRSDWQLHFENVVAMVAPTTLHIPTDNSEVYSSHLYGDLQTHRIIASRFWSVYSVHVQNGRVRGWFVGSLDKSVQVGCRLKMLLWEFAEADGEGSSMEGQGSIANMKDTGPFKATQSPSLKYTMEPLRQLSGQGIGSEMT
ncbi:hypothetical protein BU17DRAFT_102800 [Hysterangium stoloniferum]|nr:hypothetical protein BU17DRAFT_102800 [Hysterangium stoloniferum]